MKLNAKDERPVIATRLVMFASLIVAAAACNPLTAAHGQTNYQVIKAFGGTSGISPVALIEGSDGSFYGATEAGGSKGEGLVFRLSKDGKGFKVLHHFLGHSNGGDGSSPQGLIEGKNGTLYGTTRAGGSRGGVLEAAGLGGTGNGTVFSLNKDGSGYTVLRRFTCRDGDACEPWAGVTEGREGALYGTTLEDGREHQGLFGSGHGAAFKLNKDGSGYQILHTFMAAPPDGHRPLAALLAASDGALYGTTDSGGTGIRQNGTVFKLSSDGTSYQVLHNFQEKESDGSVPRARLVEGRDGVLYGTTRNGGAIDYGTVFRMNRDGSGYKVLHSFTGGEGAGDGAEPDDLIEGSDGVLYGTAPHHGRNGGGTVFKLDKDGSNFAVLRSFTLNHAAGSKPNGLLQTKDGALYGTTMEGGAENGGTIFLISSSPAPLAPGPISK